MCNEQNHDPKKCYLPSHCNLPYTACIQSEIPVTPTVNFEEVNKKGDLKFKEWPSKQHGQEKEPDHFRNLVVENVDNQLHTDETNIGTQQLAKGDSGSGHWMYNKDEDVAVLIGVSMLALKGGGPSMIQKTTDTEISSFIKNNLVY